MERMVFHSDCKYLNQRLLPAIINFLSLSYEDSYHHLHQKNLELLSGKYFKIFLLSSKVLFVQCCAALFCIAVPALYLTCVASLSNGKTILVLGSILRFFTYKRDIVNTSEMKQIVS